MRNSQNLRNIALTKDFYGLLLLLLLMVSSAEEMREILRILSEFKKAVAEKFGRVEVILFGSQVRNEGWKESDIDILVISEQEVDIKAREEIYDIAYEIGLKYDVVLDVSVYSRGDWERYRAVLPFFINVEKEGVIV